MIHSPLVVVQPRHTSKVGARAEGLRLAMSKPHYGDHPKGCRFSTNLKTLMVPVSLEDLAVRGTRAQRRFAVRELRKLKSKAKGRP